MLTFGQPLGLWALLAVPAVLAIHFLQRESRRVRVSTLFLLEQLAPESAAGRRFERLRHSVPLWLQVLSVLLLTWLLVQPRWLRRDSVQRVVIVLDSSVSMSAFRSELTPALAVAVSRLGRVAATTEWQLAESDTTRPTLYSGTEAAALLRASAAWQPHLGTHDFLPALVSAQALLRGSGTLLFVSDRPTPVPEGAHLLTIGHPIENCGFAGVTCEGRSWRALVRNYGTQPQRRHWWIESQGQKSPATEIVLAAGQTTALAGEFPPGASSCEVVLDPDAFTWDDRLPLVVPRPKALTVAIATADAPFTEFFTRFAATLEHTTVQPADADLRLAVYDPFHPGLPAAPAIVLASDAAASGWLAGEIVPEHDPLTEGLNWSGLLSRETLRVPAQPGDRTLVWQGDRPLLFIRLIAGSPLLVVNFDLRSSNAARLPAFVLLLSRFAEGVRQARVQEETRNVECHQPLTVAAQPGLAPPEIPGAEPGPLRAPERPGFFEVRQANRTLLRGAAQFADVREADFRAAATADDLREVERHLVERNSRTDFLTPLWLLALGVAMVASWTWRDR